MLVLEFVYKNSLSVNIPMFIIAHNPAGVNKFTSIKVIVTLWYHFVHNFVHKKRLKNVIFIHVGSKM